MSIFDRPSYPSAANLIGNVNVPRNTFPLLRAAKRRHDPDGTSSSPYYPNANGKTLRVGYTKDSIFGILEDSNDITLTGDSLTVVLNDLNTFFTTNSIPVRALDMDGFLALQNTNPGAVHYIRVSAFDTSADDAAPILGFAVFPFPGSTSYAGDVASAPGSRLQSNPQTTALLSKDDTLGSGEINRGLASILEMVEGLRSELYRDVVVHRDVFLTFSAHAGDGLIAARINDDDLRLFVPTYPTVNLPINVRVLSPSYRVLDDSGQQAIQDFHASGDPRIIEVSGLFYATALTPFDVDTPFLTWGTPNGGTIIGNTVVNKDKHAATAITSIVGNIVHCAGATFVTKKVKAGDPVEFAASVDQPFDHSGWFAIDAVIDETHLAIRPMAIAEDAPTAIAKPRWLNPAAGGTLRVAVGRFIPAGDVYISIAQDSLVNGGATHTIRLSVGVPFVQTLTDDRARQFAGNINALAIALYGHIATSADAHAAAAITGFTSATSWADGSTITGTSLKQTIEDVLTDLKAAASGANSGSARIGAAAISIAGSTPNSLAAGSVLSQMTALLTALQTHVVATSGAHAATAISYAGGGNWADGATNPATTVEGQLDKIITDLGGSGGAAKLGFGGSGAWADGTTNPATTIEAQLDKIISDLSPSTGSAKIGGAASGTDISAGTLAAQIANLAVNWLKLSRDNLITGLQTFQKLLTASAGIAVGGSLTTFTSFTFTANATTDLLTATAHPTKTGDGPVNVSNTGGSLPGGLAAATNYWTIFDTTNTLKLARSFAEAMSGVAIDITSAGSGTNTLSATGTTAREADANVVGRLNVTGLISPVQVGHMTYIAPATANVVDFNLQGNTYVRINIDAGPAILTGIANGSPGQIAHFDNIGSQGMGVSSSDGSSQSDNQFLLPGGSIITVAADHAITFIYDSVVRKWRLLSKT